MFKSFAGWLDEYVRDHGPSAVLQAAVGLMAFAGLLGTIFGSPAIRAGAFVVVVLFLITGVLLLLADRHGIKQERNAYRQRLNWYYEVLSELSSEPLIAVDRWQQRVQIDPNGDTHETIRLEAVAARDIVYFIRLTARSRWNQPKKHLRRIKMTAHGLNPDGTPGTSWHIVSSWEGDKLISHLDLDPPILRGKVIRFEVTRTWPAKCQPLMRDRRAEEFLLHMTRSLEVRHAEVTIVLPKDTDAVYELFGADEPDVQLTADREVDKDGRKIFHWQADKVPARTKVGIRLQLK